MGLFDGIKKKREMREQQSNIKRASKLRGLKAERVKLEGRVKIINLEKKEKARIKKAKTISRRENMNPVARKFSDNLKKNLAENKKKRNKKKPTVKSDYGKGVFW